MELVWQSDFSHMIGLQTLVTMDWPCTTMPSNRWTENDTRTVGGGAAQRDNTQYVLFINDVQSFFKLNKQIHDVFPLSSAQDL